jgi:hypothetical protein
MKIDLANGSIWAPSFSLETKTDKQDAETFKSSKFLFQLGANSSSFKINA